MYLKETFSHTDKAVMDRKFCERVEKLAKQHGYHSMKILLEECEVSYASYYKWKRGEPGGPSAEQAVKLAEKLHTSVEWLINGTRPANSYSMNKIAKLTDQVQKTLDEIKLIAGTLS